MLKQGKVLWKAAGGDVETATEKELRSTAAQNLGQIGGECSYKPKLYTRGGYQLN